MKIGVTNSGRISTGMTNPEMDILKISMVAKKTKTGNKMKFVMEKMRGVSPFSRYKEKSLEAK